MVSISKETSSKLKAGTRVECYNKFTGSQLPFPLRYSIGVIPVYFLNTVEK